MYYIDTYRFSPVANGVDLPVSGDYFHMRPEQITKEFLERGDYFIDREWWSKQYNYCMNGYTVPNATSDGQSITIPGRYYFYLNFWWIRGLNLYTKRKEIIRPRFNDMHLEKFFEVRERMIKEKKNNQWQKSRQKGFSEMGACDIGYEYSFFPGSQSVIVAGEEKYTDNMMGMVLRGLDRLINTQFFKKREIDRNDYILSENSRSEIYALTARNNAQVVSGKSPSLIYFEEIGIWKKGFVKAAYGYVEPSLEAEGYKSGYACFIGCVCKGTKVYSANGELKNIEDLKKEDGIYGYDNNGICKEVITNINPPQKKECYRITTEYGDVLECSYDHPILTSSRNTFYQKRKYINNKRVRDAKREKRSLFKQTKDLTTKDHVAMVDVMDIFGEEKLFDARLVGMLIGDGSYGYNKTPVFSNCDKALNDYVDKYDTVIEKSYITNKNKEYRETRIKGICNKLRNIGIYGQTKERKRLPKNLHLYDKESLANMIGGLFDTDGCFTITKCYNRKAVNISITQLSYDLLLDIKYVLLKFGIHSNLYQNTKDNRDRKIKSKCKSYILQITNSLSIKRFRDNIKLLVDYKQAVLDSAEAYLSNSKMNMSVSTKKNGRNVILIENKNVFYNRIVSIENIGMQDVYNLTTGDSHTYIANGMITHNTGGEADEGVYDAEHMYYNPNEYNNLTFPNMHEKDPSDVQVGCFVPAYYFELTDNDGNSKIPESIEKLLHERDQKSAANRFKLVVTKPIYASESFQTPTGGFFGETISQWCNERKSYIYTHREAQIVKRGKLLWVDRRNWTKGVIWEFDDEGDFLIAEHPEQVDGKVEDGMYVAATDSYDQDEAAYSDSLGACWVKKMFSRKGTFNNQFVAGYVGRPTIEEGGSEAFYEKTALLCAYYKALNLVEYSKIRILDWYKLHNFEGLLMERPSFVSAALIDDSRAQNRYGIDPSTKIDWLKYLSDWLADKTHIDECVFPELLAAWAKYRYDPTGRKYNCDITIATSLCQVAGKERDSFMEHAIRNREPIKFKRYKYDSTGRLVATYS